MYDYLEGQVASRGPARLVLDVGGVGYELSIPLSARFPSSGRVRAWVHFVVREDAHALAGFEDKATRDLFRLLLTVRGVGPTLALAVLSGLPREPLIEAVASGDLATLTRVRGVGKKTAEQIVLDLRDKATDLRGGSAAASAGGAARDAREPAIEDAVAALVSIGYPEKEARASVERASKQVDRRDLERLVRAALTA